MSGMRPSRAVGAGDVWDDRGAVLPRIVMYSTPKGEHDGLLPASSTHRSETDPRGPFRRQRDLHRRHVPGNSR